MKPSKTLVLLVIALFPLSMGFSPARALPQFPNLFIAYGPHILSTDIQAVRSTVLQKVAEATRAGYRVVVVEENAGGLSAAQIEETEALSNRLMKGEALQVIARSNFPENYAARLELYRTLGQAGAKTIILERTPRALYQWYQREGGAKQAEGAQLFVRGNQGRAMKSFSDFQTIYRSYQKARDEQFNAQVRSLLKDPKTMVVSLRGSDHLRNAAELRQTTRFEFVNLSH